MMSRAIPKLKIDIEMGEVEEKNREEYAVYSPRSHVLKRPDRDLGGAESVTETTYVFNRLPPVESASSLSSLFSANWREVTYNPAFIKCFDEVRANAWDRMFRDKMLRNIVITVDRESGHICIKNDGQGIPLTKMCVKDGDPEQYIPSLIFGTFNSGSNFDDEQEDVRYTGGRFGLGVKLCNVFSKQFHIDVADPVNELRLQQTFTDNMGTKEEPIISKWKLKRGYCSVKFLFDFKRLGMEGIDDDTFSIIERLVIESRASLHPRINLSFNGLNLPFKDMRDFARLFSGDKPLAYDFCKSRDPDSQMLMYEVCAFPMMESIAEGACDIGFVNSLSCSKGRHMQLFRSRIKEAVTSMLRKSRSLDNDVDVTSAAMKSSLFVIGRALVSKPTFASQSKDTLTTSIAKINISWKPSPAFTKCVTNIVKEDLLELHNANLARAAKKQMNIVGTKRRGHVIIDKYDSAVHVGKRNADCTLILTEGDSAKALAVAGLSVVGRERYGVFPLRGKPLNVRNATISTIMQNNEAVSLMRILGIQLGKTYESTDSLPYSSVWIFTDQDPDGAHITGLIMNFFHTLFPSILTADPCFLKRFVTPLIKAFPKCGSGRERDQCFFSQREFDEWAEHNELNRWTTKYYKGLGTSTSAEAREYFLRASEYVVPLDASGPRTDELMRAMFDDSLASERKRLLTHEFDPDKAADYKGAETMLWSDFILKDLLPFSNYDNVRSIPSVVDGLKNSQRKVLWTFLKQNLTKEVKVAQVAARIAELTEYHHGEDSLVETVVGMAQNHVGCGNNINLLKPVGQFGSRLNKPKEHAAARYIFTRLEPIARKVFPKDDDAILDFNILDGKQVEPKHFLPVIPWVLVNMAFGIGTGWSSNTVPYHPEFLCSLLRRRLMPAAAPKSPASSVSAPPITQLPWFSKFTGKVQLISQSSNKESWVTFGTFERLSGGCGVRVTELPIGYWSSAFLEHVKKNLMVNTGSAKEKGKHSSNKWNPFVNYIEERSTESKVDVVLYAANVEEVQLMTDAELVAQLKLKTTGNCNNLHAFDERGRLRNFPDIESVLDTFVPERMKGYKRRKAFQIEEMTKNMVKLENKARFLEQIMDESLVLHRLPKEDLEELLRSKDFVCVGEPPTFDYLLSMPYWSTTLSKFESLRKEMDSTRAALETLKATPSERLWLKDLDAFEVEYNSFFKHQQQTLTREAASAPVATKRKRTKNDAGFKRSKKATKK